MVATEGCRKNKRMLCIHQLRSDEFHIWYNQSCSIIEGSDVLPVSGSALGATEVRVSASKHSLGTRYMH
jgi:hypothetical protein